MEGAAFRVEEEQLHGNFLWYETHISLFATLQFDNKIPPSTLWSDFSNEAMRNEQVENETTGEEAKQLSPHHILSSSSSPAQQKWGGFYTVSNGRC